MPIGKEKTLGAFSVPYTNPSLDLGTTIPGLPSPYSIEEEKKKELLKEIEKLLQEIKNKKIGVLGSEKTKFNNSENALDIPTFSSPKYTSI